MSFVINTTVDKNQELLDAYKESYESTEKDVFLISQNIRVGIHSFALALSSDFFKSLLSDNQRDVVNVIIPDIDPEILKKVVEYIYIGWISLDSKFMAGKQKKIGFPFRIAPIIFLVDFIEACNLLHLKATISCERKLVFDKVQKLSTFKAKATSTPVPTTSAQNNLDSLIDELEQEENVENVEYHLKQEESGQILEVYEISNIEETEMHYETTEDNEDMSEEQYELLNVITEGKTETVYTQRTASKPKKPKSPSEIKPRVVPRVVDEDTMAKAIKEVFSNSSR